MAKKSTLNPVWIALAALLVVLGVGFTVRQMQANRRAAAETAATWMITGPACPTGAVTSPLPRQMDYEEVGIAREVAGAVQCNSIRENGNGAPLKICQFIGPGAMKVTTAKGTYSFTPAAGVDASLVIRDDTPSCVLHVNPALFALG